MIKNMHIRMNEKKIRIQYNFFMLSNFLALNQKR